MSTCVNLVDSNFKIHKKNKDIVLKILKDFAKNKKLDWCAEDDILESNSLKECFENLRYPLKLKGNYYEIKDFEGEKLGDEKLIFGSIAQYIKNNSYLEYIYDDGDRFRLCFNDSKCTFKYPKIIWEE